MKTQTYTHEPEFSMFLRFFGFMFGAMLLIVTVMYLIFEFGTPVLDYLRSVGFMFILYPVVSSIIGAYGARKHTLTISEINDPARVADWAVELLEKNEMIVVVKQQSQTVLQPTGGFYKWYARMFKTAPATVSYNMQAVTITGLSKHVDIIDTKIKFGRVEFKEQPYKHS
ncbi:hypothetical protein [Pontibacter burrus]|uniref:Uncharacterized protein n=1 Tax=Pontibacter burrus TaxID=2704466 RepID=A0A6B3LSA9_9BACT|nr:hypothetical protein [Pontibacter burrus]NEM97096.1 hypothetical protein [Pontibacter burrus]